MTDQIARNEKQLGAILRRARKNAGAHARLAQQPDPPAPWRYRTKERLVSLPTPNQPGFKDADQAAVEGRKVPKATVVQMPGAALPGTFGAAFQRLKISVKWLALDEASKRKNTRLIEEFLELRVVPDHPLIWRDVPVKNLRRIHIEELLGRFIATPHKAKHLLVGIRKLVYIALRQDWIKSIPQQRSSGARPMSVGKPGRAKRWRNLKTVGTWAPQHALAMVWRFGSAAAAATSRACAGTRGSPAVSSSMASSVTLTGLISSRPRTRDEQAANGFSCRSRRCCPRSWMRLTGAARPSWSTPMGSPSPPSP